jgi:hypothetical protein
MFYIQSSGIWGLTDELRKCVVSITAAASLHRVFVMWYCTQLIQRETLVVAPNEDRFFFLNSSYSYFSFFNSFVYQ